MARKTKPPGQEHWTWEEIRMGRKLSKGEKRYLKMAKALGATEDGQGGLNPPTGEAGFTFWAFFIGLFLLFGAIALLAP